MAKNFIVLLVVCSSSFLLSLAANGDETSGDRLKSSEVSSKTKRAIEEDDHKFSPQNELGSSSLTGNSGSELPFKDDQMGPPLMLAKRAPSGFTGMRGKKQQEYTDLSPNDLDWSWDDEYAYNDLRNKKAPLGFNGVRGKKLNLYDYESTLLDQLLRRLYVENNEQQDNWRSNALMHPSAYPTIDDWDNTLDKRAPVGFTGMRGKRPLDFPFDGGKRAANAFFGVRGKRDFKRSAQMNSGYFGMRGKKQPGFLGFRNKFVGVRGKKDVTAAAAMHRLESQLLEIPMSNYRSSPRFLIDSPEFFTLKRTPNGFLGMRGKRQINTDALEDNL